MSYYNFRQFLLRYFKNGCLSKSDKFISLFSSTLPFQLNATKISNYFAQVENSSNYSEYIQYSIENYTGSNLYAKKISDFLKTTIGDNLLGAYVHGSVATSEEIPYSDFDGFIILKNETILDSKKLKRVAQVLGESEKIMFEMDPLQHHGWFILTENDLKNYPEYYLPSDILNFSKCLFGKNQISLRVKKTGFKNEYIESFHSMVSAIHKKLESKSFLKNYYSFKNLLSQFMLLPSFYIQAKTANGIYKKFSFEKVKTEIKEKYNVMDEISFLRKNWNYHPPSFYRLIIKYPDSILRLLPSQYFSGDLPQDVINKFDDSFIKRMQDFINNLKDYLEE